MTTAPVLQTNSFFAGVNAAPPPRGLPFGRTPKRVPVVRVALPLPPQPPSPPGRPAPPPPKRAASDAAVLFGAATATSTLKVARKREVFSVLNGMPRDMIIAVTRPDDRPLSRDDAASAPLHSDKPATRAPLASLFPGARQIALTAIVAHGALCRSGRSGDLVLTFSPPGDPQGWLLRTTLLVDPCRFDLPSEEDIILPMGEVTLP